MTNERIIATNHQTLAPTASMRPLSERLLEMKDADLQAIQGQGRGVEFSATFDNAFKNGFKNIG